MFHKQAQGYVLYIFPITPTLQTVKLRHRDIGSLPKVTQPGFEHSGVWLQACWERQNCTGIFKVLWGYPRMRLCSLDSVWKPGKSRLSPQAVLLLAQRKH